MTCRTVRADDLRRSRVPTAAQDFSERRGRGGQRLRARRRSIPRSGLLASIVENSRDAIVSKDLDGLVTSWNRAAERLFGYRADEMLGRPITLLIPPDRHDEEASILQRIRRGERVDTYETVRQRKDGTLVDVALTVSPIINAAGRVVGASKIARDITDGKRLREQQELLLREMGHRAKNLFALTNSMVTLSARFTSTPQEMAAAVGARLAALAAAHDLTLPDLARQGARSDRPTTLGALAETVLSPYGHPGAGHRRVAIDGPEMRIGGSPATAIALLLNEFGSNAAKYGALSTETGRVDLRWSVEDDALQLVWQERGGPAIAGEPASKGFGSLLVHGTIGRQLGGRIDHDWAPDGLTIRLSVPLGHLETPPPASEA